MGTSNDVVLVLQGTTLPSGHQEVHRESAC